MSMLCPERKERVVAIEYYGGLPHSVFTSNDPHGRWCTTWDFHDCPMDGQLVYHESGRGGGPYTGRLLRDPGPPIAAIWLAGSVRLRRDCGKKRKRPIVRRYDGGSWLDTYRRSAGFVGERALRRWGYKLLRGPLVLPGGYVNPFDLGIGGSTEYCSICKCFRYSEWSNPCEHVRYCDDCGELTGEGCDDPTCRCEPSPAEDGPPLP